MKLELFGFGNAPKLGDNYLDYKCYYTAEDGITYTLWLALSGMCLNICDTCELSKEKLEAFYTAQLQKLDKSTLLSFVRTEHNGFNDYLGTFTLGERDGQINQKQYYHTYPRIIFNSQTLGGWLK